MKYLFIILELFDGEREYLSKTVHEVAESVDAMVYADHFARDFWLTDDWQQDDGNDYYTHFGGEVTTRVHTVKEINKAHYKILKLYL